MCDTCGCNITPGNQHLVRADGKLARTEHGKLAVTVLKSLLSENDQQAMHNRQHFDKHHVLALNLMSSPGSGKTALLEATIEALKDEFNIAVIEGDLETENDAQRIRAKGITAVQITTGSACHLDAHMVHNALHEVDLATLDIVFIENVGNLVCPASFDLGHHRNVTLISTTEGDDKPAKYPVMFRAADLVIVNKTDLLTVMDDFNPDAVTQHVRDLANEASVIKLSARSNDNLDAWLDWVKQEKAIHDERLAQQQTVRAKLQAEGVNMHAHEQRQHPSVTTTTVTETS